MIWLYVCNAFPVRAFYVPVRAFPVPLPEKSNKNQRPTDSWFEEERQRAAACLNEYLRHLNQRRRFLPVPKE